MRLARALTASLTPQPVDRTQAKDGAYWIRNTVEIPGVLPKFDWQAIVIDDGGYARVGGTLFRVAAQSFRGIEVVGPIPAPQSETTK